MLIILGDSGQHARPAEGGQEASGRVEGGMDAGGELGADEGAEVSERGGGDAGDAAEVQEEALLRLLAYAFDITQGGSDLRLAAATAMMRDTETVSLIPETLQEFERLRVAVDEHRIGVADPDDEFHTLRQADDGEPFSQAEFGQGFVGVGKLSLAAVDDHKLRKVVRMLRKQAGIASVDHLIHGGVVIRSDHGLDEKMPVVLLGRHSVAEDHAGGHGIGALYIGVVETFDVDGQFLHAYGIPQLLQNLLPEVVRVGMLPLFEGVETHLLGILGTQLKQGEFVTLDRDAEGHALHLHIGQKRHQHFGGKRTELVLNLCDEHAEHIGLLLFDIQFESEIERLYDSAVVQTHEVAERLIGVKDHGEHIHAAKGGIHYQGLGVMLLQRLHLLLIHCRLLELHQGSSLLHQGFVAAYHLTPASLEQTHYLLYILRIFLPGNSPDAAASTPADMEIEAGTELLAQYGIRINLVVAGTQGIHLLEEVEQIVGMLHRTVGAEIARAVPEHAPCQEDLREFVRSHTYPRIGLGVLEQDIVFGLVLLDEIVLKQQGIRLGIDHRVLCVRDFGDHHRSLARQPLLGHEILRYPLVQILSLTHINHIPLGVIIPVDTRGMRKQCYFFS